MREKEFEALHKRGFVILQASRSTNAPIGWKNLSTKKCGYINEMQDPALAVYKNTFNAKILARSHCGFYLGHGNLCCIDLDTKKDSVDRAEVEKLVAVITKTFGEYVVVETTKSNGYHIYFLYEERLPNNPDWTGIKKIVDGKPVSNNWLELYYSKRFMACYLSNSKKYSLIHGEILKMKVMKTKEHTKLLSFIEPYKGKISERKKSSRKAPEIDKEVWEQTEVYVKQLEEQGLDITGDNPQWFKIGKAFASAFGQKGFDMFNRVSQFSASYNADTIEDVYTRYVDEDGRKRDEKITIRTFFKICQDAGLTDLKTLQTLQLHPPSEVKEFQLDLLKKESMGEHSHTVVSEFLKYNPIITIDKSSFYIFEQTHWVKRGPREIVELINSFVDRSTIDPRFIKRLRTIPYLKMMLEEIALVTHRDAIEPITGNLKDGVYVNMENGILHINLKTGKRKLLDHEAGYYFTTILPYCYEPQAACPRFDDWMAKQIPDETLHEAYYAFVASCLTKHKADIIMMLAGETSTGKSSLIDITRRVIGIDNCAAISAGTLFSGAPDAATQAMQMENKLLAYDFDSQPFKHLEMLLKVAAQEPIIGWQMHVTRRPVVNYGRLMLAMNPYNYSVFNAAVARRFVTINMNVQVEKDNTVIPAIYENELAGIFNHVMNIGMKHLIENGGRIKVTGEMKKATLDFHLNNRDAVRWFNEKYVVLKPPIGNDKRTTAEEKFLRANKEVSKVLFTNVAEMYKDYRAWLEDVEGYSAGRIQLKKHFAADLELYGIKEGVFKIAGSTVRGVYIGVK